MPLLPLLPVALMVGLAAPAPNGPSMLEKSTGAGELLLPSPLDSARVEVVAGRAVLVGGGFDGQTMRRGESKSAQGRTHLEVALGGQVRVWWTETMSIDVFGPSSVEWVAEGDRVTSIFHQLSWADVEIRRGEHELSLPASWRAEIGRGAFRLRGIAGGPSELFHHAGRPVLLEWLGNPSQPIPPLFVYPGSSVRLDQPRHVRRQPALPDGQPTGEAWALEPEAESLTSIWPWRSRTDTDADVARRERIGRTTRVLDEPFGGAGGRYEQVVTPGGPTPSRASAAAGETRGAGGPLDQAQGGVASSVLEREERGTTLGTGVADDAPEPSGADALEQLFSVEGAPPTPEKTGAVRSSNQQEETAELRRARSEPRQLVPFDAAQWRGLRRAQLNGTGALAAERGTGVEVRVLGGGRTKVFVSSGSPAPRWCFTPRADYLMHPGAVAVLEADGRLRMSFGTLEEHRRQPGRPNFDRLISR